MSQGGLPPPPIMAPHPINTHGWTYDSRLTPDENYLALALLVARSSSCTGGQMGVVLVQQGEVSALAVNSSLYDLQRRRSDVHAEANCLCFCARHGKPTAGATVYITMPPCKDCFGLLQAAGVTRLVFRRQNRQEEMDAAAQRLGLEMVPMPRRPGADGGGEPAAGGNAGGRAAGPLPAAAMQLFERASRQLLSSPGSSSTPPDSPPGRADRLWETGCSGIGGAAVGPVLHRLAASRLAPHQLQQAHGGLAARARRAWPTPGRIRMQCTVPAGQGIRSPIHNMGRSSAGLQRVATGARPCF